MAEPIEIRPTDIIKRPADIASLTGAAPVKKGNIISQFKNGLEQVKEIKKLLDELGINMGDLIGGAKNPASGFSPPPPATGAPPPRPDARAAAPPPPAMSAAQQVKNFCRLLQIKYGDITIAEMLEKLRAEFGNKKISDFLK